MEGRALSPPRGRSLRPVAALERAATTLQSNRAPAQQESPRHTRPTEVPKSRDQPGSSGTSTTKTVEATHGGRRSGVRPPATASRRARAKNRGPPFPTVSCVHRQSLPVVFPESSVTPESSIECRAPETAATNHAAPVPCALTSCRFQRYEDACSVLSTR